MADDVNLNVQSFSMSEIGEVTFEKHSGEFKAKIRLGHRDHLRKDSLRRELLGGQPGVPTDRALTTSSMIAEVAVRVIDGPQWWKESNNGLDLADDNVLRAVWEGCLKVEDDAIAAKRQAAAEAKKALRDELKAELDAEAALSATPPKKSK